MLTDHQAKYYAYLLQQRAVGDQLNSISQSLLSASVDINPHQIEAALFAFRSPLSKGVILADEVGLGKTIEAGLVLCQYWAVGKRKLLVIAPAALRKQWSYELLDKFGLSNEILDTKNYNDYERQGKDAFAQGQVILCSYYFAAKHHQRIARHGFDLAVIDEAHKLRNVYRKSSKTARAVAAGLVDVKKLLLTATPFQNSLMELYGLVSVIDNDIFGDPKAFRANYMQADSLPALQERLQPFYQRTLRQDVKEYINYTRRLPLTQEFDASNREQKLYDQVSDFLRRTDIYAVPHQQRTLTTLIIRKILASSTYAIIGTLKTVLARLEKMLEGTLQEQTNLLDLLDEDAAAMMEEAMDEQSASDDGDQQAEDEKGTIDLQRLKEEIATIRGFIDLAQGIRDDAKAKALIQGLEAAFAQASSLGARRKALIFTESTRTQQYIKDVLERAGYGDKLVLFNGSNSDAASSAIYQAWAQKNPRKVSGIRAADRRMALVEYFRDKAEIMIATEAAAEGLNLQFCSLVVNYDLPWNPQRIEQRIGRCHRYGQKSDVVVVNFVNRRNYADQRVYQLLSEKFSLFSDVFGASDEILGQIDSVDFEKRILSIYQECRSKQQIDQAFTRLQEEMQPQIASRMEEVRQQVLRNFDIDVQERLRNAKQRTSAFLSRYEHIFWTLTMHVLGDAARFDSEGYSFALLKPVAGCQPGKFDLVSRLADGEAYRLSHPLAQYVIKTAIEKPLSPGTIVFSTKPDGLNVALPQRMQNKQGTVVMTSLQVDSFDRERHCLFTGIQEDGTLLSQEECERLFLHPAHFEPGQAVGENTLNTLHKNAQQQVQSALISIDSNNLAFFREEEDRIFRWERDMVNALEKELDTIKRKALEAEREARQASTIPDKLAATKRLEELDRQKRRKRNELADREDELARQRRHMITELDKRRVRSTQQEQVFVVHWAMPYQERKRSI
ncbi:MAG: SNF2-related protein [Christensenellales bacterium]|jgi:ERCC4-related helicase